MKTKVLYTCEICNTDYAKEEDAKKCESEHSKYTKIVGARYTAHYQYPHQIEIKFADGASKWYKVM